MRLTIYFKNGKIEDISDVQNIEHIVWYDDPEVWIYTMPNIEKTEMEKRKYLRKDIEEIKIRME